MRSQSASSKLALAVAALLLAVQGVQLSISEVSAHRLPEANIYSWYTRALVVADGNLTSAEWTNAAVVDLTPVPLNSVEAYLLVQNNDTMLFLAYDVVGDLTEGANDSAAVSFDGDHNAAPTNLGDGEFTIKASNDSSCQPFSTRRCHHLYSASTGAWTPEDPMDQGMPFHSGLWAEVGFGPSPRTITAHRTYEFSIPLAVIGWSGVTVEPGDVVGFYAARHASPFVGVRDADSSTTASWPDNAPLGPNGYGNLYLAAQSSAVLTPDYSYKPAMVQQPASHQFTLRNVGGSSDSFDLRAFSSLGWNLELHDNLGTLLTDHGGNASLPDMGPLLPGETAMVLVIATPPPTAIPGTVDVMSLEVRPWSDPSAGNTVLMRSAVPYSPPWSDDLESMAPGWAALPRPVNDWGLGTPSPGFIGGPSSTHSGAAVWGTNLAGNYSLSSFSILETPYVRIPDYVAGAHLLFWQWYDIVGNYGDGAWVEVSLDGGQWALISPEGGYPAFRFGGQPAYAGASGGWVLATFNLTAFAGKSMAFRFIMWDWLPNGQRAGWYVDDVAVQLTFPAAGLRIIPTTGYLVGSRLSTLEIPLNIQNVGSSTDVFDLTFSQALNWKVDFLDSSGQPLTDTERPKDGFKDTGPVAPGDSAVVRVRVTILGSASPGEMETITVVFHSSLDILVSAGGQYRFQLALPMPFLDDIEAGMNGWLVDSASMWHQVNSCQPSPPPWFISYSPCHSWWFGQDFRGNYDTGTRTLGNLTSPPIEVFGVSAARLSFRYWYETEPTLEYDQRWILIRTDNNPWPKKGEQGSHQMSLVHEKTWLQHNIDISTYIGHIVQVRFFFDSVDEQNNQHQGWHVDDVNISAYTPGFLPPDIALTRPEAGEIWTAARPQNIAWTASDDLDPVANIKVWVNYSLTGSAPWSPVSSAQGVPGDSSPVPWVPPCANTTNAALNATAVDSFGLASWTGPVRITLDCSRPRVISWRPTNPPDVQVKSNVSVTFSERMNVTSAQAAFSVRILQGWIPVAGTFSWSGNTMYFIPTGDLRNSTTYQVNVTTQAKDISRPGNELAAQFTWQFATSSHADSPPTVNLTSPKGGEEWSGSTPGKPTPQLLLWRVVDDFDAQVTLRVWVNYSLDGVGNWTPVENPQPFNGTLNRLWWQVPCANSTQVRMRVDALDTGGRLSRVTSGPFEIDCSPPIVVYKEPTGNLEPPFTNVVVSFNESMDHMHTQAALGLWKLPEWTPVAGVFSWSTNTMTLDPAQNLVRGSTYQANLSSMAKDTSDPGNIISNPMSWQFAIASVDPPRVNYTDPANGTTGVSVGLPSISVRFTVDVMRYPGEVNITPWVDFDTELAGNLIRILILGRLQPGTLYTVLLRASRILDERGNHLDGNGDGVGGDDYVFSFTTASTSEPGTVTPSWMWGVPLVVAGFIATVVVFRVRRRRERERRRRRLGRKRAMREAKRAFELGKEDEGAPGEVPQKQEVTDSSSRPPF